MRITLSLLTVFALVFTLAACGGQDQLIGENADNKITIWAWDPNFNIAIMNAAKEIYLQENLDVEFEIVDMTKSDLEQQLHDILLTETTDGLPDIVLIDDYNAKKYLQSYPGSFYALDQEINHKDFLPYKVELPTVDGNVYSVPFDTGVTGFYYRKDILEDAGYSSDDLENITWGEFIEIGKVVKSKTGIAMIANDFTDSGLLRVILNSSGSWYFNSDGNPSFVGNETLKGTLDTYKRIYDAKIYKPTKGWLELVGALNDGSAASVTTGVWITSSVKAGADQTGLWRVAPTPRLDIEGAKNASNLGGSSWYVLASGDAKMSVKFLNDIFASNEQFYQDILVEYGAVASYKPAAEGNAYSIDDPFFGGQKVFSYFAKWGSEIPKISYGMYTYEAEDAIIAFFPDYLDGKITVEELLEKAEALAKNQIGN